MQQEENRQMSLGEKVADWLGIKNKRVEALELEVMEKDEKIENQDKQIELLKSKVDTLQNEAKKVADALAADKEQASKGKAKGSRKK